MCSDCLVKKSRKAGRCYNCYLIFKYGYCKNKHFSIDKRAASGKNGYCQDCTNGIIPKPKVKVTVCSEDNCERKVHRSKLCGKHYKISRYGICLSCNSPADGLSKLCVPCQKRGGPPKMYQGRIKNTECEKYCSSCKEVLSRQDFYKNHHTCKKCLCLQTNKYRNDSFQFGVNNVVQTKLNVCVKCWEPLTKWHADHIIPRSLGGTDDVNNLQVMCEFCNVSKNNREDVDYRILLPGVLI